MGPRSPSRRHTVMGHPPRLVTRRSRTQAHTLASGPAHTALDPLPMSPLPQHQPHHPLNAVHSVHHRRRPARPSAHHGCAHIQGPIGTLTSTMTHGSPGARTATRPPEGARCGGARPSGWPRSVIAPNRQVTAPLPRLLLAPPGARPRKALAGGGRVLPWGPKDSVPETPPAPGREVLG